ncbi:MAG: hypothetical protein H7Y17_04450 [Chlorobia bacterium]|nr:hypothetical protein [Fimbriimonadaceae bacterium]
MPLGTYEDHLQPVRGDELLDRVLGWLSFACALPVFGLALYRLADPAEGEPTWVQPLRVALILLALIGIFACTRSSIRFFKLALILFTARLVGACVLYPWSGGPRFSGSEIAFDLVVIGYCLLRLKGLSPSEL